MKTITTLGLSFFQQDAMKLKNAYRLLPFLLLLLVTSCSKKDGIGPSGPVDPRDQFVGTYTGTLNKTLLDSRTGVTTNSTSSGSFTFVKGGVADELTSTNIDGTHTYKLTGSTITVVPYEVKSSSVFYRITGSGSFSENSLTFASNTSGDGVVLKALFKGAKQ
jgi:hypothetical protein